MFGSRQGDADSIFDTKKSNIFIHIAPHKGQNNDVILFTLEIVHDGNTDRLGGRMIPANLEKMEQLTGIRSQNGYLFWGVSLHNQVSGQSQGQFRFIRIQMTLSFVVSDLFFHVGEEKNVRRHASYAGIL
jgi:hypothetical protein